MVTCPRSAIWFGSVLILKPVVSKPGGGQPLCFLAPHTIVVRDSAILPGNESSEGISL